jgi:hypothetical protein
MSSIRLRAVGFLAACGVLASVCSARDIYVATNGNDGWPGTSAQPKRNIKSAISSAVSGDVIRVRTGTYYESWIVCKSGVKILSEDGRWAAKVNGNGGVTFRFENGCTNAEVDGFEVYSTYGSGSLCDGLVRAYNCDNIRILNMLVHDAPRDGDCIKVGGQGYTTTNVVLDGCVVYNPAPRDGATGYQECVDFYPATSCVIRNSWLYHTPERGGDALTFCKGGCVDILWENNVFGPVYAGPSDNASCMAGGPSPAVYPACTDFTARNNLFLECTGDGAFGILGVRNCYFYNNIIWGYKGARAAIEFWTALVGGPDNENCQFYNNIVMNQPTRPVYSDRGYAPAVLLRDYNIYYQTSGYGIPGSEPHTLTTNPQLTAPATPAPGTDTWASVVARFRPLPISITINAGTNLGGLVPTDINGVTRPIDQFDIGAYEVLVGDVTADGHVDAADLLVFGASWGLSAGNSSYDASCDFNGDNRVDVSDLLALAGNWGR